jgi:putative ABC transport system permease protein
LRRTLEVLLFEVAADDPWALVLAPVVMLMTALIAGSVPAWRAARVDPARVLESQ